jgi:prophage regulatory protein
MTDKLLTLSAVREIIPLSRSTIYTQVGRGEFPEPKKVGKRSLWRSSDIQAWIARGQA